MNKITSVLLTLAVVVAASTAAPAVEAYYDNVIDDNQNVIMVDKKVAEPGSVTKENGGAQYGVYRENLSVSDAKFAPSQEVYFKISVENTGTETLRDITVTEHIPAYLNPLVGAGNYDKDSHTITYRIAELKTGEVNTKYFKMQVDADHQLPSDISIIKQVNRVTVQTDGSHDSDTAQFYIEHKVEGIEGGQTTDRKELDGITEVPRTGALGLGLLALSTAGLAAGLRLRKMA